MTNGFTKAEKAIIELLMKGSSNREIAEQKYISERTVKFHLTNIYKKLGVKSRAEAINRVAKVVTMN